jgi:hypothetical protein
VESLYRECVAGLQDDAPAFIGRALELVRILALLRAAPDGGAGGAVLRAAAGMGKTAFCRRLAREARGLGWQVRAVQAGDWTRPYGLTTDLIEPLLREGGDSLVQALGSHASAVLAAMTPIAGTARDMALPIGRHQVVGAVRRLLVATAQGKPVLLIVDDAHAADDASAELLAQLAASGAPLFVLLACRPALPPVLDRHVSRMVRAGTLQVIELGPLSEDESALLAARAAAAPQPGSRASPKACRSRWSSWPARPVPGSKRPARSCRAAYRPPSPIGCATCRGSRWKQCGGWRCRRRISTSPRPWPWRAISRTRQRPAWTRRCRVACCAWRTGATASGTRCCGRPWSTP